RVPRPYGVDRARAVVVTEWVNGTAMTDLLRSPRCSTAAAKQLASSAGVWLRRFHAAHCVAPMALDIEHKLEQLESLLESPVGSRSDFRHGLDALRRRAPEAGAQVLPCSWLHGDFKPDNLLCDDGVIVGIDVRARNANSGLYDIAYFINHLHLLACQPRSWRWAVASGAVQRAFMSSYFADDDWPRLPLLWLRLYLLLAVW